jgi:hypothetical protein
MTSRAETSTRKNTLITYSLILLAIASGAWAYSLGEPDHSHRNLTDAVVIGGLVSAMFLGFLLGTGIKGSWGALLNLNRIIAWPMAFGYVWIHYAYHLEHGQPGGLAALDIVPRVFFVSSFVWIAFHAGVAAKTYGAPWKLRPKTTYDWYVALSWLVLIITIPVFSVPVLGASQILMALAWLVFAPHLSFNVYQLARRTPAKAINSGVGLWLIVGGYVIAVAYAAVLSFPK